MQAIVDEQASPAGTKQVLVVASHDKVLAQVRSALHGCPYPTAVELQIPLEQVAVLPGMQSDFLVHCEPILARHFIFVVVVPEQVKPEAQSVVVVHADLSPFLPDVESSTPQTPVVAPVVPVDVIHVTVLPVTDWTQSVETAHVPPNGTLHTPDMQSALLGQSVSTVHVAPTTLALEVRSLKISHNIMPNMTTTTTNIANPATHEDPEPSDLPLLAGAGYPGYPG